MEDRKEWKTGEKSDIEIRNLSVSFQDGGETVHAMEGVNAYFPAGSVTGLIGESGSGKSLLGMSILGLLSGQARVDGTCMYKGMDLYRLPEKEMQEIRGKEISLIPQNPTESLNPIRRIGKQLTECMTVHGNKDKELADSRRDEFLRRFGFSDPNRINRAYSFQLSGGMNQRVISAMGLMNRPKWVIADEPTTALDVTIQAQILDLIRDLNEKMNTSVLFITHDLGVVSELCDTVIVMYTGRIVEKAPVRELFNDPKHPYTVGLFGSIPNLETNSRRLAAIDGMMPDPTMLPKGCKFADRCKYAEERCHVENPQLMELEDGHKVRCFRCMK